MPNLIGKNIGDKVNVDIPAVEAYGEYRNDLVVKVPNEQLPGPVEVGMSLQAQAENGMPINVLVKEVNEDHAVIDGNHPFAGKNLIFDIEVVSILTSIPARGNNFNLLIKLSLYTVPLVTKLIQISVRLFSIR